VPDNYAKRGCYDVRHEADPQECCPIIRPRSVPIHRGKRDTAASSSADLEMVDLIHPHPENNHHQDEEEMLYYPSNGGGGGGEGGEGDVEEGGRVAVAVKRKLRVLNHYIEMKKTYLLLVLLTAGVVLQLVQVVQGPPDLIQVPSPPVELHVPHDLLNATFAVLERAEQVATVAIQLLDILRPDLDYAAAAARGHHTVTVIPQEEVVDDVTPGVDIVDENVLEDNVVTENVVEDNVVTENVVKDNVEDDNIVEDYTKEPVDDNTGDNDDKQNDTVVAAADAASDAAAVYLPVQLRPRSPNFPGGR